ncbi:MAG: hypothetical protein ABNH38_07185 [Tateyamaria sp.]|uniref:hypothetical protein n=1 Tax=Tateyamaria sp. TaxID=1929288 RepID=UPI0032DC8311
MPLSFRIIPERGLVVVEFTGYSAIDDFMRASAAYVAHPDYVAGQKQLVDMTRITGFEKDYVRFMEIQAAKAERLAGAGVQSLCVYVAPAPIAKEIATLFTRTWADITNVVTMVQDTEAEALTLLGQPEGSIDEMLRATGVQT